MTDPAQVVREVLDLHTWAVVDVCVNSALAGDIADQAVAVGARAVWFQLGVVDDEAAERVRAAGLLMVMDRCPVIEWRH